MASDPLRPPAKQARKAIGRAVGKLERLKLRRRALLKKLAAIDDEIRQAKRFAQQLINDVAPERQPYDVEAADVARAFGASVDEPHSDGAVDAVRAEEGGVFGIGA
jgi:hypothetical protein